MEIKLIGTLDHRVCSNFRTFSIKKKKKHWMPRQTDIFPLFSRWKRPSFSLFFIYFPPCSSEVKYISAICFLVIFFPEIEG